MFTKSPAGRSQRLIVGRIAQDAPLSEAGAAKAGHGVSYSYSSLDKRSSGDVDDKGRGSGDNKAGGHTYAPLFDNGDRDGGDGYPMAGKDGGVISLTSRHHIAIPISYFCIGFLGRYNDGTAVTQPAMVYLSAALWYK